MPSLRTFCIRTSDCGLLRSFFERHSVELGDLPPDADAKMIAIAAEKSLQLGTRSARDAIDKDIEKIDRLASDIGEVALDRTILTEGVMELPSRYARAIHVYLYDRDGFRRAEEIIFNDTLRGGKQWTGFPAGKNLDLARDDAAVDKLRQALRIQFDTANVHLEIFDRLRPQFPDESNDERSRAELVQITIYTESRPNTEWAFIDGMLGTEVRRSVLEASVTYEPSTGMIECVGRQRDDRAEMARVVAVTVLGCSPDFRAVAAKSYDLSVLQRRIDFKPEPIDRIDTVKVAMLRLVPLETNAERITVENMSASDKDIWSVIEDRLGSDALASGYTIDQAKIVIRYQSGTSNTSKSLPIVITHPNRSNLKERTEIELAIANKYLPKWGLVTV